MSIQCETLQNRRISPPSALSNWANGANWIRDHLASIAAIYSDWAYQRRVTKSRRTLESLPEHILQDIGWPCIDDRLADIGKKPSK